MESTSQHWREGDQTTAKDLQSTLPSGLIWFIPASPLEPRGRKLSPPPLTLYCLSQLAAQLTGGFSLPYAQ